MKHVLTFERTGRAVGWDGQADIYLCSCGKRWETKPGAQAPVSCPPKEN
jgi:hypothetical protein